jgi:hypothetical protein
MMSRTRTGVAFLGTFAIIGMLVAGPAQAAGTGKVNAIVSEYIVRPKPKTVAPGKVQFVVKNVGGETHEFVVVRGSDPAALPTDADGAVDETQIPAADMIGEVEDIASQKTGKTSLKLKAGTYIVFCNIVVEDAAGGKVSHFAKGMVNTITVKK